MVRMGRFAAAGVVLMMIAGGGCGRVEPDLDVDATGATCTAMAPTNVATSSEPGSFTQTTTAQFDGNTNSNVTTTGDQVQLASNLVLGSATASVTHASNNSIAGGTYEFVDFTINSGVTLTITGDQPLIIRASGTVTINGTIQASGGDGGNGVTFMNAGAGGAGGPGGGAGGAGIFDPMLGPLVGATGRGEGPGAGANGWHPGGGAGHSAAGDTTAGAAGGAAYGNAALSPISAGSGGGGGSGGNNCGGGGGGGGGGYVQISATTINIGATGAIWVKGGNGGTDGGGACGGGGGGSGGSIHLRASNLTVAGTLDASGGTGGTGFGSAVGGAGAPGRIRLDAATRSVTGTVTPASGMNGGVHATPGSTRTPPLELAGPCTWGALSYTVSIPSGTTLGVNVLDGTTGAVILSNVPSGGSLAEIPATTPIRLEAAFGSTIGTATLADWTVSYTTR